MLRAKVRLCWFFMVASSSRERPVMGMLDPSELRIRMYFICALPGSCLAHAGNDFPAEVIFGRLLLIGSDHSAAFVEPAVVISVDTVGDRELSISLCPVRVFADHPCGSIPRCWGH